MNPLVKAAYRSAVRDYSAARARGELDRAFEALERAHILGQRFFLPHAMTHLRMFRVGQARRDRREMLGQIVRLIATVPGYVTGWVPMGNPGGANISALKEMPLSGDLAILLRDFNVTRDVMWRLVLLPGVVVAAFLALSRIEQRRAYSQADLHADPWLQLATTRESAPAGDQRLHEIKWDGYRLLARRDGDTVTLQSRNGAMAQWRNGAMAPADHRRGRLPRENRHVTPAAALPPAAFLEVLP
jgi:hypothetical protein